MAQRHTGRGVATAAPADGEAKRSTLVASLRYRGNCSHRMRRKTDAPESTFLFFSFMFSPFHLFTTNVTRALPLETIKWEAGATSKRELASTRRNNTHTSLGYTPPLKRDLGSALSQKLVTPTTNTPVQGNTSNSKTHWT
jgi:hypothetical protein